ncbi:MAG: polyhydroxybutyrate depolymerase [Pseudomonadota bacterium]
MAEPCKTATGSYHLALPKAAGQAAGLAGGKTPLPVVFFFHGHNSSGANVVRNRALLKQITGRGYLLVAPNGTAGPGRRALGWPARPDAAGRRDDLAFIQEVRRDLTRHVTVDPSRMFVTGFSSGGSMAWYLACYGEDAYTAFAPIAGGLRRPLPENGRCPSGPQNVLHLHGFSDAQVPLEGRAIREWHQGDVFEGLAIMRATNACRAHPNRFERRDGHQCRRWSSCAGERRIAFCLHPRGHEIPPGWSALVMDFFAAAARPRKADAIE